MMMWEIGNYAMRSFYATQKQGSKSKSSQAIILDHPQYTRVVESAQASIREAITEAKRELKKQASGKKSITFIELLLVIAILGIFTALSIPGLKKSFNNFEFKGCAQELQSFMNYLRQRSIVEGATIYLTIDNDKHQYWANIKDSLIPLKTHNLPAGITVDSTAKIIVFYPDGSIDKVTLKLHGQDNLKVAITTQGVFNGVKLQAAQ